MKKPTTTTPTGHAEPTNALDENRAFEAQAGKPPLKDLAARQRHASNDEHDELVGEDRGDDSQQWPLHHVRHQPGGKHSDNN